MRLLAAIASKPIANITFPSKPDSVRHFLKYHGFTDTDIRTIISGCPRILSADFTQTIEPKANSLQPTSSPPLFYHPSQWWRLMPRLHVVEILKRNESVTTTLDIYSIMCYTEQTFMEMIVVRHKEVAPELHEMYVAACQAPTLIGSGE